MKKYILLSLAVLLVLVGLFYVLRKNRNTHGKETFKIVEVTRGNLLSTVTATGVLEPRIQIKLTSPKRGQVDEILVEEGDTVRKGQRIAMISSEDRINLIDAALMNLEKAKDTGNQSEISEAENELKIAEAAYQRIPLLTPIAGLVTLRNIEPGEKVDANTTILEVSDKLLVKVLIDETDIGKVKEGMKTKIILDAYPDEDMQGKVIKIAYSPTIESNVTNYEALVEFTSSTDKLLKSGMTADVDIITFEKKDTLLLPKKAVEERKGRGIVLIPCEGDRPYPQEVQTGNSDENNVEIVSGIKEGDKVIIMERSSNEEKPKTEGKDTKRTGSGDPSRMMRSMTRGR